MKSLTNLILFFAGGFLAGFISLIFLVIIPINNISPEFLKIITSVLVEESAKLLILNFMFKLSKNIPTFNKYLLLAAIFGASFSLFELLLIKIDNASSLNYTFFITTIVHIITSILLATAIYRSNFLKKLSTSTFLFLLLAFFIHLCYNLNIQFNLEFFIK